MATQRKRTIDTRKFMNIISQQGTHNYCRQAGSIKGSVIPATVIQHPLVNYLHNVLHVYQIFVKGGRYSPSHQDGLMYAVKKPLPSPTTPHTYKAWEM